MKKFDYSVLPGKLLTPEISNLLSAIHEYRGKQGLFMTVRSDTLKTLLDVAVIQSTDASNRIEGIFTSDARLKGVVTKDVPPYEIWGGNPARFLKSRLAEKEEKHD